MKRLDITGCVYGKLTVLQFVDRKSTNSRWECRCECKYVGLYFLGGLRSGKSTQCAMCSHKNKRKPWTSITSLFYYLKHRGLLCHTWQSIEKFYKSVGDRPKKKRFLRRHNLSKPYSPSNFFWSEKYALGRPRIYSCNSLTLNLTEWGKQLKVSKERVRQLVNEYGSIENVLKHRAARRGITMAKVIEEFPEKTKYPKHNLEKYADGKIWELEQGVDFDVKISSFRVCCYLYAKHKSLNLITRSIGKKIYVQFTKKK